MTIIYNKAKGSATADLPVDVAEPDALPDFIMHGPRFGRFPADSNITCHFPKDELAVTICLTPAIGMAPEFPQYLNYVAIVIRDKRLPTDAEIRKALHEVVQFVSISSVLPASIPDGEPVSLPIITRGEFPRTPEDVANDLFPVGVLLCIPCDPQIFQQNLVLARMAAFTAQVAQAAAAGEKPAGVQTH